MIDVRYIVAQKHIGGQVQHAIVDSPEDRANIRIGHMGVYSHALCDWVKGTRKQSSLMSLLLTSKDIGVHTATSDRKYFGEDFTTDWVENRSGRRVVCQKCAAIIKIIETYGMEHALYHTFMFHNVSLRTWPKLIKAMREYNVSRSDFSDMCSAGVEVKDFPQFFAARYKADITSDAAILMWQNGEPYNVWSNFKSWPDEWIETQYA